TALTAPECLPLGHKEPTCPDSTTTPARSSPPTASLLASGPNSTATAPRGKAPHVAAPMTAVSRTAPPLAPRAAACTSYCPNPERRPAMLNLIHRLLGIDVLRAENERLRSELNT